MGILWYTYSKRIFRRVERWFWFLLVFMKKNSFSLPSSTKTVSQNDVIGKNIFDILGLADLAENQKAEMLGKMLQIIYQRVVARIMDVLPEDALRQLKDAIDAEDEQTATAVLTKHGMMSFPELMTEEALFMKYEMDALITGDSAMFQ